MGRGRRLLAALAVVQYFHPRLRADTKMGVYKLASIRSRACVAQEFLPL